MRDQIIVTIGREYGSGGHQIAEHLSKAFDMPLYDKEFFSKELREQGVIPEDEELQDESLPTGLLGISMAGYYALVEQSPIAAAEFDFMIERAKAKESFVVVGRCAEYVLRENRNLLRIFVSAEHDAKVERTMRLYDLSEKEAERACKSTDKMRRFYHNFYAATKWGDSRNYDLLVNSTTLGVDATADVIEDYVRRFQQE